MYLSPRGGRPSQRGLPVTPSIILRPTTVTWFNIASGANDSCGPPWGTITSSLWASLNATAYPWQDSDTSHQWPARRTRPPAPEQPRPQVPQRDTPTVGGSALAPGFGPVRDSPASVQPSGTGPSQRPCQDLLCVQPNHWVQPSCPILYVPAP